MTPSTPAADDARAFLTSIGLPVGPAGSSSGRFPDGVAFRIEIPSTEGPRCFEAVLEEADRLDVPVRRVSQGSGTLMLTDEELDEMVSIGADAGVEVSLFAQPVAAWTPSATARSEGGAAVRSAIRGIDGLVHALADVRRAADHGIRSVLLTDVGLLAAFGDARRVGWLPPDMQAKISVTYPIANPATARVLVGLGADTLNLVTDLSVDQIAEVREVVDVPIDLYVEAPDDQGGFVRYPELPELIRVASPVYVKLGLRNAPNLYPTGRHLEATAIALGRERVRRARIAIELLERSGVSIATSEPGADGLAVPVRP